MRKDDYSILNILKWVALSLTLVGIITALISCFSFNSLGGVTIGFVCSIIGLWLKPTI